MGYTWGTVGGSASGHMDGYTSDWFAVRNVKDINAIDALDNLENILKYTDSDDLAFDATPIWVKMPIMQSGYNSFFVNVTNSLQSDITVDAYAVPLKGLAYPGDVNTCFVADKVLNHQIITAQIVNNGNQLKFGLGGLTITNVSQWPIGWLVIKVTPSIDPPTNSAWFLAVSRF